MSGIKRVGFFAILLLLGLAAVEPRATDAFPGANSPGVWRTVAFGFSGSIPKQPIGFQAMTINETSVGGFLGLEISQQVPDDRKYDFAPNLFNDRQVGRRDEIASANAGITKRLSSEVAVYVGGGAGDRQPYVELYDAMQILSPDGHYWVKLDDEDQFIVYALGGLIVRVSEKVGLQLGGQSDPGGVTVGIFFLEDLVR